jgi:hypothetical protein
MPRAMSTSAAVSTDGTPRVQCVSKTIIRLRRLLGPPTRTLAVAILVTVLATLATPPLVALLTDDRLQAWIAALIASATLLVGLILGTAIDTADDHDALDAKISELESRTGELGAYETFAEHLRDALRDLRQVLAKELPNFSTRDFVETGVFAPAHALLQHDHRNRTRGDVRFRSSDRKARTSS